MMLIHYSHNRERTMRKIIGVAALTLAAITPALGADIEPKAAVDFLLSTCLPAMDDLANVERIAQEKNWFRLSDLPPTEHVTTTAHWRAPADAVVGPGHDRSPALRHRSAPLLVATRRRSPP